MRKNELHKQLIELLKETTVSHGATHMSPEGLKDLDA